MRTSLDPKPSVSNSPESTGTGWLYLVLLAMQTGGVCILYQYGVPWYRGLLANPTAYEPRQDMWIWLSAIVLVQVGYWVRHKVRAPLPKFTNVVLGHVVLFAGSLSFLLATTVFCFVFLAQKMASRMPLDRQLLMFAALFSLFCYMQELQRLGRSIVGKEKKPLAGV